MHLISLSKKPVGLVHSAFRMVGLFALSVGISAVAPGLDKFSGEAVAKDAQVVANGGKPARKARPQQVGGHRSARRRL